MTLFGKMLVLLNAALSLGAASWALALYGARVDWSNNKAKEGKPAGQLVARQDQVKELNAALQAAQPPRANARGVLALYDQKLFKDRRWYENELNHFRTVATPTDPARVVVYEDGKAAPQRKGLVRLDPQTGLPALEKGTDRSGKPLGSPRFYDEAQKSALEAFEAESKKLDAETKKDIDNTTLLAGDPDASKKGLQQELNEEKAKRAGVVAEQDDVRPQLINALVESELVLQRQKALQARIEELKKEGVAAK